MLNLFPQFVLQKVLLLQQLGNSQLGHLFELLKEVLDDFLVVGISCLAFQEVGHKLIFLSICFQHKFEFFVKGCNSFLETRIL